MDDKHECRILRIQDVVKRTGLSRSGIYKKMSDGVFPRQIKLGARATGWLCHEVTGWLNQQITVSRANQGM